MKNEQKDIDGLFEKVLNIDSKIVEFLMLYLPYYSSDDRVAVIDDCWKTILDEWEDKDQNEIRHWSKGDCANEIIRITGDLIKESIQNLKNQKDKEIENLKHAMNQFINQ